MATQGEAVSPCAAKQSTTTTTKTLNRQTGVGPYPKDPVWFFVFPLKTAVLRDHKVTLNHPTHL